MFKVSISVIILWLVSCTSSPKQSRKENQGSNSFKYVGGHLISVSVRINESIESDFILDTGIGVNLISKSLCDRIGCKIMDQYTGQRMSGQSLDVPMSSIRSLSFSSYKLDTVPVGIWEMKGFLPETQEFSNVGGFLSLDFFKNQPFSIDYETKRVVLENEVSLEARKVKGKVVRVKIDFDKETALTVFLPLILTHGVASKKALMEVDTGSDDLILHEKYASGVGVRLNGKGVKRVESKDETGHSYVRYFTEMKGVIHLAEAPNIMHRNPKVMFQKIIHDGLIGDAFLRRFKTVTFNLPKSELIFSN